MNTATLQTGPANPIVRLERELPDPPETVWMALTEPEQLKAWFPCTIETDEWRVGADLTFVFPDDVGMTLTGTVLELDHPRLLAYMWGEETLRFELEPTATGGTRLVLTDELPAAFAARNAAGWEICLERLVGHVPADDAWTPYFDSYSAEFAPVIGPQEGPPEDWHETSA
jgi:uncharacterized protein YndB with AHSA1/START domain